MSTSNIHQLIQAAGDGTPQFNACVHQGHRRLQIRTSIFESTPPRGAGLRLGVYQAQAACGPGAVAKNMEQLKRAVASARKFDVQLLSFPELYTTGYTLSPSEARELAEYSDGPTISLACEIAQQNQMGMLLPYVEKAADSTGSLRFYDSIAVINENGKLVTSYKKTHLYGQQERDNYSTGDQEPPVATIFDFPVGVLNCYECEFPELVRILALKGAKVIVGPTAADYYYRLPSGERSQVPYPDVSTTVFPAHAYTNNLFFAYSNRCGYEVRDNDVWHYRGNSMVCSPHGEILIQADHEQDTLLVADCIPAHYGMTHPAPDYFYLRDRRPELYQQLVSKTAQFVNKPAREINLETPLVDQETTYPSAPDEN